MSALSSPANAPRARPTRLRARSFSMHGVAVTVATDLDEAAVLLDDTLAEFATHGGPEGTVIEVRRQDDRTGFAVTDANGFPHEVPDEQAAVIAMLNAVTATVVSGLYDEGLLAVHAGALVHRGRAVVVAGPSGFGKTTLTLGLVRAGLGFLSDELAVLDPATGTVHPYPRSAHVRPETRTLIPELAPLCGRAQRDLGDGNEWIVTPRALASRFPGCRASAAPLGAVVLLAAPPDPAGSPALTPVTAGVAVMELLRGTPAASIDFGVALSRMAAAAGEARSVRLEAGGLDETIAAVLAWLDEDSRG